MESFDYVCTYSGSYTQFKLMREWCYENVGEKFFDWSHTTEIGVRTIYFDQFYFTHEEDAIMFKLRFGQ